MTDHKIPNWVQLQMKVILGEIKTPKWEGRSVLLFDGMYGHRGLNQGVYIPRPQDPLQLICSPDKIRSLGHSYHDYTWSVNEGTFFLFEDGKLVSAVTEAVLDEDTGISGFFLFEDTVVIYWSILNQNYHIDNEEGEGSEGHPRWKYFLDFKTINLFTNQPLYHEESCHDQVISLEGGEFNLRIDLDNWKAHCYSKGGLTTQSFDLLTQGWGSVDQPNEENIL